MSFNNNIKSLKQRWTEHPLVARLSVGLLGSVILGSSAFFLQKSLTEDNTRHEVEQTTRRTDDTRTATDRDNDATSHATANNATSDNPTTHKPSNKELARTIDEFANAQLISNLNRAATSNSNHSEHFAQSYARKLANQLEETPEAQRQTVYRKLNPAARTLVDNSSRKE